MQPAGKLTDRRLAVTALFLAAGASFLTVSRAPERLETAVTRIAVSADGRWLAAGGAQGRIYLGDLDTGTERRFHAPAGALNDLQFSPDAAWLAVANRNLTLYRVAKHGPPVPIRQDGRNYGSAAFSPDGRTVLTITGGGEIEVLEVAGGRTLVRSCCSTIYGEVAFTPGGTLFVSAGHRPSVWDAHSGGLRCRLTSERDFFASGPVAIDAQRGRLLIGSQEGIVRLWDLAMWRLSGASPPRSPGWVESIAVEHETGWVAYSGSHDVVKLWHPDSGFLRQLRDARPSSNLAFRPGGKQILMGTAAGTVEFRDAETGRLAASLRVLP